MKLYQKICLVLSQIFFVIEIPFSYAFGLSTSDTKLTSNLLDYSIHEKQESDSKFFRVSLLDSNGSLTLKRTKEYITGNYARYKIYSHYISIGRNNLKSDENKLNIKSNVLNCDSVDFVTTIGFNDLDYMYYMPLPLYRFAVDEKGEPTFSPYSERTMTKDYDGADFHSYIPSTFADYILETYPEKYKDYNDILDKGFVFDVNFTFNGVTETLYFSANNIYLSSDTEKWDLPTRKDSISQFYDFPVEFGKFNKNCLITNCLDIFVKYGFYYEASIRSNYGNLKYFCKGNIKNLIKEHNLKLVFGDEQGESWEQRGSLTDLLIAESSQNTALLFAAITVALLFLGSIVLSYIFMIKDKKKQFSLHKLLIFPICFYVLIQLAFLIIFFADLQTALLFNNLYGNVIIIITLMLSLVSYAVIKKT